MGRAFGTAMSGRGKGRQELADLPIPLTANLTVVACRASLPPGKTTSSRGALCEVSALPNIDSFTEGLISKDQFTSRMARTKHH